MDCNKVYRQLTNVDIEHQKEIWDERGKGYYGEYRVFCELHSFLSGYGKILMNINIPVSEFKTTEVDLVLVHETGIYVFEIKHYKGDIYGNSSDKTWTQFFRTAKNNVFDNPIKQNKYHISALKNISPDLPIYSIIVFTNADCRLHITNTESGTYICQLSNLKNILSNCFDKKTSILPIEKIDDIFVMLSKYSPMSEAVIIDTKEADFFTWITPTLLSLEAEKDKIIESTKKLENEKVKLHKARRYGITLNIIIMIICLIISILVCYFAIQSNNKSISQFKQKFLHIDEIDNEYIDKLNSYIEVSSPTLSPLTDDAVSFTASLSMKNNTYGVSITSNAKYIVMTTSGHVFEYDVIKNKLSYFKTSYMIGYGIRSILDLKQVEFYGISNVNDIEYIKITGIELFKVERRNSVIKDNLEIELFSNNV